MSTTRHVLIDTAAKPSKIYTALDPGGTTGVCVWHKTGIEFSQLTDAHHEELRTICECSDIVICEGFAYRNKARTGLVLTSVEYIGIAKLHSQVYVEQTPAQAKGFVSDDVIKRLGLWQRGSRHAMDALRHMIYFHVNNKLGDPVLKKWLLEKGYSRA